MAVLAAPKRSALLAEQDAGGMPAATGDNRVVRLGHGYGVTHRSRLQQPITNH